MGKSKITLNQFNFEELERAFHSLSLLGIFAYYVLAVDVDKTRYSNINLKKTIAIIPKEYFQRPIKYTEWEGNTFVIKLDVMPSQEYVNK